MVMRFNINKKLIIYVLDEINDKNLPINCTVGKTLKESSEYMADVTFSFDDEIEPIFDDLLCKCINENFL